MIKQVFLTSLFLIGFGFAEVADPTLYTSGAPEPATPVVNINHVENDEPMFAVSIHPVSMFILSLFDIPSIYLTIEGNLGSRLSVITRPSVIWADFTDDDEGLDIFLFELSEGLRFYFNEGHRGWFTAAHFRYDRVGIEYTYDKNSAKDYDVHFNGYGLAVYLGHKFRSGHFTSSWDIGYTYTKFSTSNKKKDDVEKVSSVGSGWDMNYTIGFAF